MFSQKNRLENLLSSPFAALNRKFRFVAGKPAENALQWDYSNGGL
jgi:hypothetical protein